MRDSRQSIPRPPAESLELLTVGVENGQGQGQKDCCFLGTGPWEKLSPGQTGLFASG